MGVIPHETIEVSKYDFNAMWLAYESISNGAIPESLSGLTGLLNRITVNPGFKVRLLGDVFADRGNNDYFTLKVLEKLHRGGVAPEITYSNHDLWFLDNYKKTATSDWSFFNVHNQQNSLVGLYNYINKGLIKQEEVAFLVEKYVLPYINPIAYTLAEDGKKIDLFMHAPNNFTAIKQFAQILGVIYKPPTSALELAKVIDAINNKFQQLCGEDYANVIKAAAHGKASTHNSGVMAGKFLRQFIWNRMEKTQRCIDFSTYPDFVNHVVHGHTTVSQSHNTKQVNLDNALGKGSWENQGEYRVFFTGRDQPANIKKAQAWIAEVEDLADKVASKDKSRVENVAKTAKILLQEYIAPHSDEKSQVQVQTVRNFKQAVNAVQDLQIKSISWKNVFNVFLFIPSIINLIKTGGQSFWLRSSQAVTVKDPAIEKILQESRVADKSDVASKSDDDISIPTLHTLK